MWGKGKVVELAIMGSFLGEEWEFYGWRSPSKEAVWSNLASNEGEGHIRWAVWIKLESLIIVSELWTKATPFLPGITISTTRP